MSDYICLDNEYSTTAKLVRQRPEKLLKQNVGNHGIAQGGLRLKEYYKKRILDNPVITVITVVLNDPIGLEKTILSVLKQTYKNIEFIIVDGGSDAPTLDIIKKYDDKIDFWISESDEGIYDAMNKGIELSTGDWINFMNAADDFYEQDTVQKVFSKNYGDADFIYGHTNFLGGDFFGIVKVWDFEILWKTMIFTHQSLFTKRKILEARKFDTKFKICGDYDIIYNSYMQGLTFFNSDTTIASFDPGFSEVSRSKMAYEKWKVVRKHRNDFQFHWFYSKLFFKRFFMDIIKKILLRTGKR